MTEPFDIATMAYNTAVPVIGMGINELAHPQQLRHQQDFINQQMHAQMLMGEYNKNLALETWDKTNYEAQVKHLKAAGLNPALLYGKGGGGGSTTNFGGSPSVSSTPAPNATTGMGIALQQVAEIKLLDAQRRKIEAETTNMQTTSKVNEASISKIGAETNNILTDTELKEAQTSLAKFNSDITRIEAKISEEGYSLKLGTLNAEFDNLLSKTKLNNQMIKESAQRVINLGVESELMKKQKELFSSQINVNAEEIELKRAEVKSIVTGITQRWSEITNEGIKVGLDELKSKLTDTGISDDLVREITTIVLSIGLTAAAKGKKITPDQAASNARNTPGFMD